MCRGPRYRSIDKPGWKDVKRGISWSPEETQKLLDRCPAVKDLSLRVCRVTALKPLMTNICNAT